MAIFCVIWLPLRCGFWESIRDARSRPNTSFALVRSRPYEFESKFEQIGVFRYPEPMCDARRKNEEATATVARGRLVGKKRVLKLRSVHFALKRRRPKAAS